MDVTLDIQAIDVEPEFMDIRQDSLKMICRVYGIPTEYFSEVEKHQWVRLYKDGSFDVIDFK